MAWGNLIISLIEEMVIYHIIIAPEYEMGIVKGNNTFGVILTGIRDDEYRRRAGIRAPQKSVFANAATGGEAGATAMVV